MIGAILGYVIDFSIFQTPEAWISLLTLMFLEVVLGVDNIVFISITTDRLPLEKRPLGRKLGLAGAMIMRILFLSLASFLVHMVDPLFGIDVGFYSHEFAIRDIVLLLGGSYLIYKGISELGSVLSLDDYRDDQGIDSHPKRQIGLGQAVGTIMVMDVVFSIDSVITAVGLAEHLIIMIMAVMFAVVIMMIFIDAIADFINAHVEMKILALAFITVIGVLLVLDAIGIGTGIEVEALGMHLEKLLVYFAMVFSVLIALLIIRYNSNLKKYEEEHAPQESDADK